MATWREMLEEETTRRKEDFESLVFSIGDGELDREFDDGYGEVEGAPFTAWGPKFVYFPVCYDGSESVGSVPRNPCDEKIEHSGGW